MAIFSRKPLRPDIIIGIILSCLVLTLFALPSIAKPSDIDGLKASNSTKDLNTDLHGTSIANITNGLEGLIGCFKQAEPDEPQLCRTSFIDCFHAEERIAAHDTRMPIDFRNNNDSTFIIPNMFVYRTCAIYISMVSADAEDFFYVSQIREVVIDIARRCTSIRRMVLGGKGTAGPRNLVEIDVLGRP